MSNYYKPKRLYIWDDETKTADKRDLFIIAGEYSDGVKVWKRCDENGKTLDGCGYIVGRAKGKMIAFLSYAD